MMNVLIRTFIVDLQFCQIKSNFPTENPKNFPMRQELSFHSANVNQNKVGLLKKYLLAGTVLDVGCGNGLYGLEILALGGNVLQIDILDRRAPEAHYLPFQQIDANMLKFPDDAFNNVVAFDIMEHLDDDIQFLANIRRICCGRLILSVPNADDEPIRSLFLTHIHHTDKTHRREYTHAALANLLHQQGFENITIKPQYNAMLPYFAHALAKKGRVPKLVAHFVSMQCLLFERLGIFENQCIADWFCIADTRK